MSFPPIKPRHYKTFRYLRQQYALFFHEEDLPEGSIFLNMNDTYAWALAMGYDATDDFDTIAEIYEKYGDWWAVVAYVALKEDIDFHESITPYYDRDMPGWRERQVMYREDMAWLK